VKISITLPSGTVVEVTSVDGTTSANLCPSGEMTLSRALEIEEELKDVVDIFAPPLMALYGSPEEVEAFDTDNVDMPMALRMLADDCEHLGITDLDAFFVGIEDDQCVPIATSVMSFVEVLGNSETVSDWRRKFLALEGEPCNPVDLAAPKVSFGSN
jgi:hypothetical protein